MQCKRDLMKIMTEPERKAKSNLQSTHVVVSLTILKIGRGKRTGRKLSGCIFTRAENSVYMFSKYNDRFMALKQLL